MTFDFFNAYSQGFARVAAVTVPVAVANPEANATAIIEAAQAAHDDGVAVAVFPELSLTGYTSDDLHLAEPLLDATLAALDRVVEASRRLRPLLLVGAPLAGGNRVYNCAIAVHRGAILGVVPKSHLPAYREFYEPRWFAAAPHDGPQTIDIAGRSVPFGSNLIFSAADLPGLKVFAEVCEDMWVPIPPSSRAALAGATVLLNLSSSPSTVARAEDRRLLVRSASDRCLAAYVYAAAGQGESSTDLSWDGQTLVYECGKLLAETERFPEGARMSVADVDLGRIRAERLRQGSFDDNARRNPGFSALEIPFTLDPPAGDIGLRRNVERFPFVPSDPDRLALDCSEAYRIQVAALRQRLTSIGDPKIIIGVSGGLDSTHALLVAARTMDLLGRPRSDILAHTLPGFATGDLTKSRAWRLGLSLGVTFAEIDIRPAAERMLADLDHPYAQGEAQYDVTFENVQAGLRTDYLFRLAGRHGGIVLGTGDLSELALGWCTYGVGDHMSMYAINAGVPKTLIQHLIGWVATTDQFSAETNQVLAEILAQEISPELVPADGSGALQSTQAIIGPYALQDFTLYWTLRHGARPSKVAFLQWHAWRAAGEGTWPPNFPAEDRAEYHLATIKRWLGVFYRRFFQNQFKRSCLPNGPKVLPGGSLSPRGDWRMPSDASAAAWLADLERVPAE